MSTAGGPVRLVRLDGDPALCLQVNLAKLRHGPGDPTHRRVGPGQWWRASRTPEGPATSVWVALADGVRVEAWGPGAGWTLEQAPRLLGAEDDHAGFEPRHPLLTEVLRRRPGLRIGASDRVHESLAPACLEQVVTGKEAFLAFRLLVREFGEPAPGPAQDPDSLAAGLLLPPEARTWARIPSWRYLAAGVEQRRSAPLVRGATRAAALERTLEGPHREADRALRSIPGIGHWTSAEVRQRAHGDTDAWSVGDYHVGGAISYALLGEKLDDAAATEALEPYRGHRYRVQLLLELEAPRPPRRGPRFTLPTHTPRATRGRS
ncbi:DNA-3-methyladenine glycosylase family protein [Auraticoccus monumenti]|uniref:3-methyladenine DNA glycosylase/8-oxoguanine DNA glycosylase n=1 Tax=Auraticoccus monumenti TaxID=675864 RepID=A0A1G6SUC7_9ACTN|nr:3-methyladenine DNA glycosylase [Auraticoccus monumenti]SDD19715.1 3-methyladenine DNA glycosylase/8-oxoguanine DNA glycosylase [Auraticoccus monumenti]